MTSSIMEMSIISCYVPGGLRDLPPLCLSCCIHITFMSCLQRCQKQGAKAGKHLAVFHIHPDSINITACEKITPYIYIFHVKGSLLSDLGILDEGGGKC